MLSLQRGVYWLHPPQQRGELGLNSGFWKLRETGLLGVCNSESAFAGQRHAVANRRNSGGLNAAWCSGLTPRPECCWCWGDRRGKEFLEANHGEG